MVVVKITFSEYANEISLLNQHPDENAHDADHCGGAGVHAHTPHACAGGYVPL
ncbi:MAG TPA: hypothetical protein VN370_02770 [Desulfitobacteriaceae bacterium]|nr:hypothetical protein [Desulfitobacteriaceae bacterium]